MADGTKLADIFVHFTGIRGNGWRNLKENDVVEFEIVKGKQGDQANDVVVIGTAEAAPIAEEPTA
jgi:cold shock CspA family protein